MHCWPRLGIALVALMLLTLSGCDSEEEGTETDFNMQSTTGNELSEESGVLDDNDCATLTWDNFGRGELRSWCTGCHSSQVAGAERFGAPTGVDFDSHAGVTAHAQGILERATGPEPDMPPVGGGDAEDRARLRQWLECGAP